MGLTLQEMTKLRFEEAMGRATEVGCPRCRAPKGQDCFQRNGGGCRPHAGRAHALIRSGVVGMAQRDEQQGAVLRAPSPQEVLATATGARGGWTAKQLAVWGVPWPPPKGWRKDLERLYRDQNGD